MGTEYGHPRHRGARLLAPCLVAWLFGVTPAVAQELANPNPTPSEDPARAARDRAHEITVQGNKADALKRASGSGTTIGEREIRNTQPESNAELLRRVPGLQVRTEDPMGLRLNLGVRGLSPSRSRLILMEEDGVPVVVSPYGEPELYYTPMVERVQRVDVVKGSDVLRYGPQTVGAVVELHTFDPTLRPNWYIADQVGSRGYGALQARYSGTSGAIGYVAQVVRKSGSGYRNMGFRATDAFGKAVLTHAAIGQLTFKIGFHDDRARTTYTGLTERLYRQNPRQDTVAPNDFFAVRRYETSLAHEIHLGDQTTLRSSLFAYEMTLGQRTQDIDRSGSPPLDSQILDPGQLSLLGSATLRDRTYDVVGISSEVEHRFQTGPANHRLRLGGRAIEDDAHRVLSAAGSPRAEAGDILTDDTTRILGLSAWLEDQIALTRRLLITPAFRYELSRSQKHLRVTDVPGETPQRADAVARSHAGGAMPGLGVIYGSAKANAFASAYLGYSAPRISQAITPQGQDANLHAERSRNYEVGVRGRGDIVRAEADAFLIQFDNQLVSNNPLYGAASEFIDGGRTRHLGAEATTSVRLGKALGMPLELDLGAQYTFVETRFVGGQFAGHTVPYSPLHSANFTLDAAHRTGLSAQVALSYTGRQYTDEYNTVAPDPSGLTGVMDPYTTLDLAARYRYVPSGVSFGLSVKSLLDRVYVSDRLPNGIFTAGFRQIFATFAWSSDG